MSKSKRPLEHEPVLDQTDQTKRAKKSQSKRFLDELAWKEVAMPDRLDDVEGFFGLEEVDGVDVVGTEGGKIEFKVILESCDVLRSVDRSLAGG
jgi:ATP-dependent RNA helicase DDX24/MAK5